VPTVVEWTGREARLLREALLLTQRGFAERLGLGPSTVSDWEAQDLAVRLRKSSQQRLDAELARAPREARERFEHALARERGAEHGPVVASPGTSPAPFGFAPALVGRRQPSLECRRRPIWRP
jgi:Helix-turn-helix